MVIRLRPQPDKYIDQIPFSQSCHEMMKMQKNEKNNSVFGNFIFVNASKAHIKKKEYSEACDFIAVLKNLHKNSQMLIIRALK